MYYILVCILLYYIHDKQTPFFIPDPTTSPPLYVYSKERMDINGNKLKLGLIDDATITNKIFMLFCKQKSFECTGSISFCICKECRQKGLWANVVFNSLPSSSLPNHNNNNNNTAILSPSLSALLAPSPSSPSPSPSPSLSPLPPSLSSTTTTSTTSLSSLSLSLTNTTNFHDCYWQFMIHLPINKNNNSGPLIDGGVREVHGKEPKPDYVSRNGNVFLCTCKSFKFRNGGVDSNGRTTCKHIRSMYTDIPDPSPPSLVIDAPSHPSQSIDNVVMEDVRVAAPIAATITTTSQLLLPSSSIESVKKNRRGPKVYSSNTSAFVTGIKRRGIDNQSRSPSSSIESVKKNRWGPKIYSSNSSPSV